MVILTLPTLFPQFLKDPFIRTTQSSELDHMPLYWLLYLQFTILPKLLQIVKYR